MMRDGSPMAHRDAFTARSTILTLETELYTRSGYGACLSPTQDDSAPGRHRVPHWGHSGMRFNLKSPMITDN